MAGRLGVRVSLVLFGVLLGLFLSSFLDTSGLTLTSHKDRQVVKLPQFSCDCKSSGDRAKSPEQGYRGELHARDNILPRSIKKGGKPRKIFIDCGANAAFSVRLFRETYPDGQDYVIHSFELDQRLIPYFAPYSDHVLHCPVAAGDRDGNITVYGESVWRPDKGRVFDMDMQWGGGVVYADENETRSEQYGRRFGVKTVVPMVDLSTWIQENTAIEDHVIFKIDVEGSEYEIVEKMVKDKTFKWIDKFYAEFHNVSWAPVPGWSQQRRDDLVRTLQQQGNMFLYWEGESHYYQDIEELHKPDIPAITPGAPGMVYSKCSGSPGGPARLALTVQVGMDAKAAFRLVETMRTHPSGMPVTLFVYGNFAQLYPDLVRSWAEGYTIGIREHQPFPAGHWTLQNANVMRMSLIASVQRLRELALRPAYYLPDGVTERVRDTAKKRGLRIVQPHTRFPPVEGPLLSEDDYYKVRDVERTPKVLRLLHDRFAQARGGILSLDSDHPDSLLISVFLMDYLHQVSGFQLVSLDDCL